MARRPRGDEVDGTRQLLGGLHGGVARPAAEPRDVAALSEAVLRSDRVGMLRGHESDAASRRPLFARLDQEDDVAVERDVQPLQREKGHQPGDDVRLVVERSAAIDVAAVPSRAERRKRPLLRVDGDDVAVAHVEDGLLRPLPFSRATRFGRFGSSAIDLDRDPFLLEHRLDVVGDEILVAGRIARIEAEKRLEVRQCLLLQ